ncbi:hypothetical protein WJX74_005867 [Apatococcus lobatus]|uniref:DNA (cytosine-5-)-methyltransferase n=1 Tax=Apatococcus lobatus TaxID=904363 RepID=A0AAW1RFT6_9CHLO
MPTHLPDHLQAQHQEFERFTALRRQKERDEQYARQLQAQEELVAPSTVAEPSSKATDVWDSSTRCLTDVQQHTESADERLARRLQGQRREQPSGPASDRRAMLLARQRAKLAFFQQEHQSRQHQAKLPQQPQQVQQQQQQQLPLKTPSEVAREGQQPVAASPWTFEAATSLRAGQYGLIEPPADSCQAGHGFELVRLLRLDNFQRTCHVEFLEPDSAPGPVLQRRFGKYQKQPDGKPLPQGWHGRLAFDNFFYSFQALEDGHIPPAIQQVIRVYTAERTRQIALAEDRAVPHPDQSASLGACLSRISADGSTAEQHEQGSSVPESSSFTTRPTHLHRLPQAPPFPLHAQVPSQLADLPEHGTYGSTSKEEEEARSGAALEAGHSSNPGLAASIPMQKQRIAACLAVPRKRIKPAASWSRTHLVPEVDSCDDEGNYLPSAAEQAETGEDSFFDDDDGGFLEDTHALKPSDTAMSGRKTSRKAYRNGIARLQRGHQDLSRICSYRLNPQDLDEVMPSFTAPFFVYEQVYSINTDWLHIAGEIYESLYNHPPVILDSAPGLSPARRQRTYTTNIRDHYELPDELAPDLEDLLGLSGCGLPVWFSELFEAGYFNTVNTRTFPSAKCNHAISSWAGQHPGEPLPMSITGLDGTKYAARKVAARYNLVPDKRHRVRGMLPEQAETLLGFSPGHTRRAGPDNGEKLSDSKRREMLGNSFQTDTVAHLLRPLKALQDSGRLTKNLVVLSLFDGIAGAAVALEKAGVAFSDYISVEKQWDCRAVMERYFDSLPAKHRPRRSYVTDCDGKPVHDVRGVTRQWLQSQISQTGIHLIIGGSPCNNITSSNRVAASRKGFSGEDSHLFSQYARILRDVKDASPSML